jgi:hypothetical protein
MSRVAVVGLCAAACAGAARPAIVDVEVGEMVRSPDPMLPLMPPYGERDALGRPHGDWAFDCDANAMMCRGWFEHGTQVQWAKVVPSTGERYVIDAEGGGWRWRYWSRDVLRAEAGLAIAPEPWVPGDHVDFAWITPPITGACMGPFAIREPDGTVSADGTCDAAKWIEWTTYVRGRPTSIQRRSRDLAEYDTQVFDDSGRLVGRTRLEAGVETDEEWYADGTPRHRRVRDGFIDERRTWYADGARAEEDLAEHGNRALRRYTPAGVLVAEATWFERLRVGTWRTWYESGKRRSEVRFADDGTPIGTLVVWSPRGARVGEADLEAETWTAGAVGTRVIGARAPRGTARVELDGFPGCKRGDAPCLRQIASHVLPASCLATDKSDPMSVWRGRVELAIGFDRDGSSGVVAIRDSGGISRDIQDCLLATASDRQRVGFAQELYVEVDVDLLVGTTDQTVIGDPLF